MTWKELILLQKKRLIISRVFPLVNLHYVSGLVIGRVFPALETQLIFFYLLKIHIFPGLPLPLPVFKIHAFCARDKELLFRSQNTSLRRMHIRSPPLVLR